MLNYLSAVTRHYFDFKGRATRAQYWQFVICALILYGLAAGADWFLSNAPFGKGIIALVVLFAQLIPFYAIQARRFHDLGHTGLLSLFILVPASGWVVLLGWSLAPSEPEANKYGPDPLEDDYVAEEPTAAGSVRSRSPVEPPLFATSAVNAASGDDTILKLEKLASLRASGAIDDDEFKQMKTNLMNRSANSS